jgi:hypothetical protein
LIKPKFSMEGQERKIKGFHQKFRNAVTDDIRCLCQQSGGKQWLWPFLDQNMFKCI